ncbi:MAG: hypothetical protein ACTS68_00910 [Candidatus Hodgkinia cicadicola]
MLWRPSLGGSFTIGDSVGRLGQRNLLKEPIILFERRARTNVITGNDFALSLTSVHLR